VNSTASSHTGSPDSRALLLSAPVSSPTVGTGSSKCLRFTFSAHAVTRNSCSLRVHTLLIDSTLRDVWSYDCIDNDAAWREVSVTINSDMPFQVGLHYWLIDIIELVNRFDLI